MSLVPETGKSTWIILLTLLLAGVGYAQLAYGDGANGILDGDPKAGKTKYNQVCATCHGPMGASQVPTQPILAAQHPEYVYEQLEHYKEGVRKNAVMLGMSLGLNKQDMINIALYLQEQPAILAGATDEALVARGREIYRGGVPETGAPACLGCHGPAGIGIPPAYPRLGGQYAEYTTTTLLEFRNGTRANVVMNQIASRLSEEDIKAVSEYISGLH